MCFTLTEEAHLAKDISVCKGGPQRQKHKLAPYVGEPALFAPEPDAPFTHIIFAINHILVLFPDAMPI